MRIALILLLLILTFSPFLLAEEGETLYKKHCAQCHGEDRTGKIAPPLLPLFLKKKSNEKLYKIIKYGLPATQMPSFKDLDDRQIKAIISYIRKPAKVRWTEKDIEKSIQISNYPEKTLPIKNIKNLVAVVEQGKGKVWIMENDKILDKFDFKNVHGGIKYTPDCKKLFVPSRDGWIGRYDINKGRFYGKVRACVYQRNIAVSKDGKYLLSTCWLPEKIVILSTENLKPLKTFDVKGKISAIYEIHKENKGIFTFRNMPYLGIVDLDSFKIKYITLKEPFEDFFIDPFENYIVGSSRHGTLLSVFDLDTQKYVFSYKMEGMPHLASASFWYKKGKFYFATPHITKPFITVWQMYDWKFVKKIKIDGNGFFVRTHPETPYLWTDNGGDKIVLIDKNDFSIKEKQAIPDKRVIHTEFNGDGNIAYISIYNKNGALILYDSITLREIKRYHASIPIGKYNFVNKSRQYLPVLLGREVYMAKCWGCHNPTTEAFGPSFKKIAQTRTPEYIKAQIISPEHTSKILGYQRNAMPKLKISNEELEALVRFIMEQKNVKNN